MRLVTYRANIEAEARLGALVDIGGGTFVVELARLGAERGVALPSTMLEFIDLGPQAVTIASGLINEARGLFPIGVAVPAGNVKLLAPIPRPRKNLFGIGLNYTEHVAESAAHGFLDVLRDHEEGIEFQCVGRFFGEREFD